MRNISDTTEETRIERSILMIEEHISRGKELYHVDLGQVINRRPLTVELVKFDIKTFEGNISQRIHPKEGTYCVFAGLASMGNLFSFSSPTSADHFYFFDNHSDIVELIARVINAHGIYAGSDGKVIVLGNGRKTSMQGLWFEYNTNNYQFSGDPDFNEIMLEEVELVSEVFAIIYGVAEYLRITKPSTMTFKELFRDAKIQDYRKSELVVKFIERNATERLNKYNDEADRYMGFALGYIKASHVKEAMKKNKGNC